MVIVSNSDYYSKIPVGREFINLPIASSADTTVGYQYDGFTAEDRLVQKVLREHYDKVYKENVSHSDPMAYVRSKYCDVTSPNFCSHMTADQRSIAYRTEKRMLQTGGKPVGGFARYDYALKDYKDLYTGGSRSRGCSSCVGGRQSGWSFVVLHKNAFLMELIYPYDTAPMIPLPTAETSQSRTAVSEWFPIVDQAGFVVGRSTREYCHSGAKPLHPVIHIHIIDIITRWRWRNWRNR